MNGDRSNAPSAFVWNAGGWFGGVLGSTITYLIVGLMLLGKDAATAWLCVACFLVLNAWSFYLWRSRARVSAYAAIQLFLAAAAAVVAVFVIVLKSRGQVEMVGTSYLPFLLFPGLMLMFYLRERSVRRATRDSASRQVQPPTSLR